MQEKPLTEDEIGDYLAEVQLEELKLKEIENGSK